MIVYDDDADDVVEEKISFANFKIWDLFTVYWATVDIDITLDHGTNWLYM